MNVEGNSHSNHCYTSSTHIYLLPVSPFLSTLTFFLLYVKSIEVEPLVIDGTRQEYTFNGFFFHFYHNCVLYILISTISHHIPQTS